jgi:VanZ family protein
MSIRHLTRGKYPQNLVIHYLIAIFLTLLSYLFFTTVDGYVVDGEQLLSNPTFLNDMAGWRVGGNSELVQVADGVVSISHDDLSQTNVLNQCWDGDQFPNQILFRISASTADLVLGEKTWHQARAGLIIHLPDGKIDYRSSNRLLALNTDQPWKPFQAGLDVDASAERVCISIGLHGSKGTFQIKDPMLYPARVPAEYSLVKNLLLVVWLFATVVWLTLLVKHYRHRPQMLILTLMLIGIAIGILMPAELRLAMDNQFSPYLPEINTRELFSALGVSPQSHVNLLPQHWNVSKFGHLLGFFLLSAILFSEKKKRVFMVLPGLVLLALVTEIMQHYIPGRGPRISDTLVDLIGIVAGWWLIRGYFRIRQVFSTITNQAIDINPGDD